MNIDPFWWGALNIARRGEVQSLRTHFGNWDELVGGGVEALRFAGVSAERAAAWYELGGGHTLGAVITLADAGYPCRLHGLPDAPPVLLLEGEVQCLEGPSVAVVGTRGCSAYGAAVARHLGGAFAAVGTTVVSGLARGIDAYAHSAATAHGRTIAVLGHGLGSTAPPSNRQLRRDIVAGGGLILSTWADDFHPSKWTFPIRNRWIAALSDVTIVVEAPMRSGALITAREALELGRDVYAVPGRIGAANSAGCLALIETGAGIVRDVEGLVSILAGSDYRKQDDWLQYLLAGGDLAETARLAGRTTLELLGELSILELRGQVVRLPGGRYALGGSPR